MNLNSSVTLQADMKFSPRVLALLFSIEGLVVIEHPCMYVRSLL